MWYHQYTYDVRQDLVAVWLTSEQLPFQPCQRSVNCLYFYHCQSRLLRPNTTWETSEVTNLPYKVQRRTKRPLSHSGSFYFDHCFSLPPRGSPLSRLTKDVVIWRCTTVKISIGMSLIWRKTKDLPDDNPNERTCWHFDLVKWLVPGICLVTIHKGIPTTCMEHNLCPCTGFPCHSAYHSTPFTIID